MHLVDLRQVSSNHRHACADATAITLNAYKFDQNRVVGVPTVVAQQLWWSIEICHQQIDVAGVIDIAERNAAAGAILSQDCAKLRRNFRKRRVAIVSVQQSRLAICRKLGIEGTVCDKEVSPAIIIVVKKLF